MDQKKVIEKLIKIAENQQKIIQKLAQAQGLPPDALPTSQVQMGEGHGAAPASQPPPEKLNPGQPKPTQTQSEGQMIMSALPANVAKAISNIAVTAGNVNVSFAPGGATQANYDAVLKAVQSLQQANKLPGSNYKVHVA